MRMPADGLLWVEVAETLAVLPLQPQRKAGPMTTMMTRPPARLLQPQGKANLPGAESEPKVLHLASEAAATAQEAVPAAV